MMGFVLKDLYLMRKQIAYILFLTLVYAVLTVSGAFSSFVLPAIVVILSLIYPINAFAWDEQARWDKFAAATPAGRRNMVAGRYLFVILLIAAVSAFVTVLLAVFQLAHLTGASALETFLPVPACALVGLLMNAGVLPILYRFGAEKARIICVAVFAAVFGCGSAVGFITVRYGMPGITDQQMILGLVLLAAATAAALAASYALSLKIYQKKEL